MRFKISISYRLLKKAFFFTCLLLFVMYYYGMFATTFEVKPDYVRKILQEDPNHFNLVEVAEDDQYALFYPTSSQNQTLLVSFSKHSNFGVQIDKLFEDTATTLIRYTNNPQSSFLGSMISVLSSVFWDLIVQVAFYIILFFIVSKVLGTIFDGESSVSPFSDGDKNFFTEAKDVPTRFTDVVGQKEGKDDLTECVNFFLHREKYIEMGYRIPKGILFVGPPGTGKTLLAKAYAGECGVTFISASGSDFNGILVGLGVKKIKTLFEHARKNTPAIIFIDEIDSIGGKRENSSGFPSESERGNTLNKLLTEMDGFSNNEQLMIIAATNRPETLDKALIRSGRFDKEIVFDPPNKEERIDLFKMYLEKVRVSEELKAGEDASLDKLAKLTAGLTGADIANIVNQSVKQFMEGRDLEADVPEEEGVTYSHLEKSIDIVTIGVEKRERKMTERERDIVAHHEAGHALVAYTMKHSKPPVKISIIPRGRAALGFTQSEPDDRKITTKEELYSELCVLLGGRIAEELFYSHQSTGAHDDIERATKIAQRMIGTFGMGSLGPINTDLKDGPFDRKISDATMQLQDGEVAKLISKAEAQAREILSNHEAHIKKLALYLLENEIIVAEDVDTLLGDTGIVDTVTPNL